MAAKKPTITIRVGAARDTININGHTFDRSGMTKTGKALLRKQLVKIVAGGR